MDAVRVPAPGTEIVFATEPLSYVNLNAPSAIGFPIIVSQPVRLSKVSVIWVAWAGDTKNETISIGANIHAAEREKALLIFVNIFTGPLQLCIVIVTTDNKN
jgi:hypothetical protein